MLCGYQQHASHCLPWQKNQREYCYFQVQRPWLAVFCIPNNSHQIHPAFPSNFPRLSNLEIGFQGQCWVHGPDYERCTVCSVLSRAKVWPPLLMLARCSSTADEGIGGQHQEAQPITPPYRTGPDKYRCVVEYQKKPYTVAWSGSMQYPELKLFPHDLDASPLPQSKKMAMIWRSSTLVDHGAHAVVRSSSCAGIEQTRGDQHFPIIKLAHADTESLALIKNEIEILSDPLMHSLPTPVIDEQYVVEGGIPVGFRMKTLFKLDAVELSLRTNEIRQALQQLHLAGFSSCHGDLSPSNLMKDGTNRITLIDFSHAGRIGDAVPRIVQRQLEGHLARDMYNTDFDWQRFHRFFI